MNLDRLKNNKVIDIKLENKNYILTIPLTKSFLVNKDDYYFTFKERYTGEEIVLHSTVQETLDDFVINRVSFSFEQNYKIFIESDIWDIYLNAVQHREVKKRRVISNYDDIRFLSIVLDDDKKMFYPYTTVNGKISFRMNDYFVFTKFESVSLSKDQINFSGYFNYPPMYRTNDYEVVGINAIITTTLDDNEITIPIEQFNREDLYEKYNGNEKLLNTGIKGVFNIGSYIAGDQKNYFKFYLELTVKNKNEVFNVRSTRVRVKNTDDLPIKEIVSKEGKKFKILIKPTKKSKYLSLQISEYNLKNEIVKGAKMKWVKIRRGKAFKKAYETAFSLLGKLPVRKKTIMFESFLGKQYSDSPRAIYEFMIDNEIPYDMYWSIDRRHIRLYQDKNIKVVRRFSVKWLLLMARAEYWISNSRLPLWLPKPKHTTYVQTWHGTPLKRLAADMDEVHMPGTNTEKYKENFIKEASKWDYLISPNAYSSEIFKRAFQFDREIIESGYPRNDFLINSNNEKTMTKIKQLSNLPLDKKIILYAPTWRDNQFYAKGKYKFDLQMDLEQMKKELGEDYIVVLRLHYLVAENLDLTGYEGFIYDFSYHEDIRELYLIADVLITDYSSVFFDYANLRRPMLFYVYDIEEYRDNLRGFYFDFEEKAPGPLVKTTDEIISEIKKIDANGFSPSNIEEEFYKKFCYLEDGNASKRVVDKLFNK